MTDEDGARLVADIAARQSACVIDYEHATLLAKTSGTKAPAAGWYERLEWRSGDGLWVIGADWTALAAQEISDRHYRYVSPVFSYDPHTGRVLKLFHAALTNDPGLDGLTDLAALMADLILTQPNPQEDEMLKKLLAALGLQENASETEALSAVSALKSNVAALSAQVGAPDPAKFAPVAVLTALQGEHAELQGRVAALQAEVDGGKLEKIIDDGLASGKLSPATAGWARELGKSNLASLTTYIETAAVVAKPGDTQSGGQAPGGGIAALSAEQAKVCELFGIAPDDFKKSLAASA